MLAYDVFRDDSWSAVEVTETVGDIIYIPGTLERLGIFEKVPIRTTTVGIYKDAETLALVPITERGAPETPIGRDISSLVQLPTVRLAQRDRIDSHEVQNLFSGLTATNLAQGLDRAWDEVDKRQRKMMRQQVLTKENHRLAALQGLLLDSDGSTVMDFFEKFGYTAAAAVSFNYTTLNTAPKLREHIARNVVTPMILALGQGRVTSATRIGALCGDDFFFKLIGSAAYQSIFANLPPQLDQLEDPTWSTVYAFGVQWMHYRGASNGMLAINTADCLFFPIGAIDVFKEYLAPGEDWAQVNELGREFYAVVSPDYRVNMMEWVDCYNRTYPLICCIAPNVLRKGTAV